MAGHNYTPGEALDPNEIIVLGKLYSDFLNAHKEEIIRVLLAYETFHVAQDEFARTIDLLSSLEENRSYFVRRVGRVVAFLPLNQPLYALACFGMVPALMATETYVRPPFIAHPLFTQLNTVLRLDEWIPNLHMAYEERNAFIRTHAQQTAAVIFTGQTENALRVQKLFGDEVLFIGNGSSHNPVVITPTAKVDAAVAGVIEVQLYNSGGDCAAPNAILVAESILPEFLQELHRQLQNVRVGEYTVSNVMIGPIKEKKHLEYLQKIIHQNAEWLDACHAGTIHPESGILEPTIIVKPLKRGGTYNELYGPVFIIQPYTIDADLAEYFENPLYAPHAGFISVYGHSGYINGLIDRPFPLYAFLHDDASIIRDTHLHAHGVERGTKPYGGYGKESSFILYKGTLVAKPTLPQRDIFEYLVAHLKPLTVRPGLDALPAS